VFTPRLCGGAAKRMEMLCAARDNEPRTEAPAMADLIYLASGFAFFALMGLYAYACDRL